MILEVSEEKASRVVGPHRYHFTNADPVTVTMAGGETVQIGDGWLAITEAEYRQLSAMSDAALAPANLAEPAQ